MRTTHALSLLTAGLICLAGVAAAQESGTPPQDPFQTFDRPTPNASGHAEIDGLRLYYEIHGDGAPLVLLHGGFMNIDALGPILPALAEGRQVIAVELEGHGRTPLTGRPLSYEQMADDIAALVRQLGHDRADVMGFSLGGGVALQTAFRHPETVRRLVVVSAPYGAEGWRPEVRTGMASIDAESMVGTIMHQTYVDLAPDPDQWPDFVDAMRTFLGESNAYDWSEAVAGLETPTLIVIGDSDFVAPDHAADMLHMMGGGDPDMMNANPGAPRPVQLAVLPGTTHFDILYRVDLLGPMLTRFLEAEMPAGG